MDKAPTSIQIHFSVGIFFLPPFFVLKIDMPRTKAEIDSIPCCHGIEDDLGAALDEGR